jgi:C4-dicarboxylate-specific signal transduction histidine kinase
MIEKLSEPQKVLLELDKIELTAHRIVKIISGLRTFSRDAKNDPMTIVGLKDIVTETLDYCQERFKNKGVDLSVSKIPEVQLECRPAQISQVILNLLNNSFDAVESQKDKSIGINLVSQNDKLEIQVWDSGTRISESILTKLMQPFFTTKQVGKGTGLGLSISKGIAEDHQGSLTYDRNSLKTQFILSVPLRQIKTKKT